MKKIFLAILLVVICLSVKSQANDPDSLTQTIYAWKFTEDFSLITDTPVDTSFYRFQVNNPNCIQFPYNAYLGNIGSPSLPNSYLKQISMPDMPFLKPYFPYILRSENQIYYNTRKPFSDLKYTASTGTRRQEQVLKILHSQNVNKDFNIGLLFDLISSEGKYNYQKQVKKSVSLFSSYILKKYNVHASLNMNTIEGQENGGTIIDEEFEETKSEDIPVNLGRLSEAESELKHHDVLLVQRYTIGNPQTSDSLNLKSSNKKKIVLLGTFSHIFRYQKNHRKYTDQNPISGFYRNVFLDSTLTADSIYYRSIRNTIQFEFQSNPDRRFRFGGKIGATSDLEKYSTIIPTDTIVHYDDPDVYVHPDITIWKSNNDTLFKGVSDESYNNLSLSFQLFNDLGDKLAWKAWGNYCFSGYRMGDLTLEGIISKTFERKGNDSYLNLYGKIRNERPGYWYNYFSSNHFRWENDFKDVIETTITGEYINPRRKLQAKAYYTLLDHYVCFDSLANPQQFPGILSVFGLKIEKDIVLGRWHFLNKIILQQSDHSDVLPLPAALLYQSTYFQHNFHFERTNGDMLSQFGFDLYFHTAYDGYAFMPATGQFILQTEEKLGNYPFLDVFINLKIKRTRLFFKYEHINYGLLDHNYFAILDYPMVRGVFKFGLSWTFYD